MRSPHRDRVGLCARGLHPTPFSKLVHGKEPLVQAFNNSPTTSDEVGRMQLSLYKIEAYEAGPRSGKTRRDPEESQLVHFSIVQLLCPNY
jgi:hypothetical protein